MEEFDSIGDKERESCREGVGALHSQGQETTPILVRGELVQRALAILAAERERTGSSVSLPSVERVCDRLCLRPAEILQVRSQLEPDDVDEAEENDAAGVEGSDAIRVGNPEESNSLVDRMLSHSLFSQDEERELGRAVRVGKAFSDGLADGSVPAGRQTSEVILRGRLAHQSLVLGNIRLAMDIAKRYDHRGLEREDLLQEGIIGLMRAVDAFDPDMGFRFSTYATWWIRQSITRAVLNAGRIVRIPVHVAEKLHKLRKVERRLKTRNPGAAIKPKDLADELGWTPEQVGRLLVLDAERFLSADSEDEEGASLLDRMRSPLPDPERCAMDVDLRRCIDRCLDALDPRAAEIVRLRFGLVGVSSETLETIGRHFGLTRERIRQIESKSLGKLAVRHADDLRVFVQEVS